MPLQNKPMDNIKKVDCALLPPCGEVLWQKTRRAQYLAIIWGNAESLTPGHDLDPLLYGWKKNSDGSLSPNWFTGADVPGNLFQDESTDSDESSEWSDCESDEDEYYF